MPAPLVPLLSLVSVVFLASLAVAGVLVATQHLHGRLSHDSSRGVQKLHTTPTPRIGGLALVCGAAVGWAVLDGAAAALWAALCFCLVPAFVSGLLEDLTKRGGVALRLSATLASGALVALFVGAHAADVHVDVPVPADLPADVAGLLSLVGVALFVGGAANAFNIVDGVNGLASGTGIAACVAFATIAARVDDAPLLAASLVLAAALAGFFVLNFPRGFLFLGDAGAYVTGGALAALAVALPARHADLTPLVGLLALAYPLTEMGMSILRRLGRPGASPARADRLHLHSLLHRSLALQLARALGAPQGRNALTSVMIGVLPLVSTAWAALACRETGACAVGVSFVVVAYVLLYRRAVRFRLRGAR
jgi:UDP-N-acetylmuramyl pentapeptide phosphotransferase/UDP-N-acetylglucosamine-1-phosphate transferase